MARLSLVAALLYAAAALARGPEHVGRAMAGYRDVRERSLEYMAMASRSAAERKPASSNSPYLTNKTQAYAVDGTALPEVSFDIGESYSGSLPISNKTNETSNMFFWFFPSSNPAASNEITIWLNGGPGCSSLEGLLQENGPFLWQYGTFKPVPNPWTWVNLTNVLWVEQPIGTGFSKGEVTITSEVELAEQFMGFFKNFVDLFDVQNRKIYITGESYAGMYVPYIASAMLNTTDKSYFDVEAVMILDPSINTGEVLDEAQAVPFVEYWQELFALNDTYMADIRRRDIECGYKAFRDDNMNYPPKGLLPSAPTYPRRNTTCHIYEEIQGAATLVNPCWDVYQVATTCPLLWDVLGFPGSIPYSPYNATIYFNRPEVKKVIHAPPHTQWAECSGPVYNTSNGESYEATHNLWTGLTVLPGVIERLNRTIIGHGNLDMILIKNGTLMTIQNMTWNGAQGFSEYPNDDFYVPYHNDYEQGALAASGVMGKTRTERGLTFVEINLSGHMVPQYQPSASYRHMEFLLGRIPSLSSKVPFTTSNDGLQALPPGPIGGSR